MLAPSSVRLWKYSWTDWRNTEQPHITVDCFNFSQQSCLLKGVYGYFHNFQGELMGIFVTEFYGIHLCHSLKVFSKCICHYHCHWFCPCLCLCHCLFVSQIMFYHHADQMSQRSQVSRISLCVTKSKYDSDTVTLTEWRSHVLSCPQTVTGQLKIYLWRLPFERKFQELWWNKNDIQCYSMSSSLGQYSM